MFNPTSQGQKFDPGGDYIRRWVPEIAGLPNGWIHQPHAAPNEVLSAAKVVLGDTYPHPLVNHAIARNVALDACTRIKSTHDRNS